MKRRSYFVLSEMLHLLIFKMMPRRYGYVTPGQTWERPPQPATHYTYISCANNFFPYFEHIAILIYELNENQSAILHRNSSITYSYSPCQGNFEFILFQKIWKGSIM